MPEAESKAPAPKPVPPQPTRLRLDEFCARLSRTVRSPELIAGFHHTERQAGRVRDTAESYRGRFEEFGNRPALRGTPRVAVKRPAR